MSVSTRPIMSRWGSPTAKVPGALATTARLSSAHPAGHRERSQNEDRAQPAQADGA